MLPDTRCLSLSAGPRSQAVTHQLRGLQLAKSLLNCCYVLHQKLCNASTQPPLLLSHNVDYCHYAIVLCHANICLFDFLVLPVQQLCMLAPVISELGQRSCHAIKYSMHSLIS